MRVGFAVKVTKARDSVPGRGKSKLHNEADGKCRNMTMKHFTWSGRRVIAPKGAELGERDT